MNAVGLPVLFLRVLQTLLGGVDIRLIDTIRHIQYI